MLEEISSESQQDSEGSSRKSSSQSLKRTQRPTNKRDYNSSVAQQRRERRSMDGHRAVAGQSPTQDVKTETGQVQCLLCQCFPQQHAAGLAMLRRRGTEIGTQD